MSQHNDPRELLVHIVTILRKLRIPYVVTGGIAVLVWGRPRFTADIDIIIELHKSNAMLLDRALRLLNKSGYLDRDTMMEAIDRHGEFNYIDGNTGVKVDFWVIKENDVFDKKRLKRKRIKTIMGKKVYFTSPEDLMLIKLKWHAMARSSKQWEDVLSIIQISGSRLDWNYLRETARRLGVGNLLKRAVAKSKM